MKRVTIFLIWTAMCCCVLCFVCHKPKGDVNGDGKVTTTDLVMLSRYLAELIELDEFQLKYADMNEDGIIDVLDLALLRRKLAGGEP